MMKIEDFGTKVKFEDVSAGQFFVKDDVIYLKTEEIEDSEEDIYNAVSTATGCHYYFDYDTIVDTVLKGKHTVNFDD